MIKASALIERFRFALAERWGYIMGTAGELWTQAKQSAVTDSMAKQYGAQWIGHRVADCSGLFSWAFKQLGGSIYHGSNTIWKKHTTDRGTISGGRRSDGQTLQPGTAVFKVRDGSDYYHIGLYVGGSTVIEAQGTRAGVTTSNISKWHAWGTLRGVSYDTNTVKEATPMQQHDSAYTGPAMVTAPTGSTVNVRQKPGGAKVGALPIGTEVEITGQDGEWSQIRFTTTAWMKSEFLSDGRG